MSDPAFPDPDDAHPIEPGCARCPALVEARECIAWGNGPLDADVVAVGEAPGAGTPDEDRWRGGNWTGMAYTARHSGRIVRELFADSGHTDVFYTNAVKCFPPDGEGSNREPREAELSNCFTHLEAELEAVDPSVVVTTGKHATRVMFDAAGRDLDSFLDTVLDPVACPSLGATVLPVLHPAYQHMWLSRLGYDYDEYAAELGSLLDDHC
ncbi:uracil-DNA glycosylase family 4 [Halarchaeum solikamskense]|uniref:uracil-DNA glycosylase n=1 Tax=Halarchaeum nitratireducens TaxID=489913 RepID=UPI001B3AC473|nr:uracil-DNA glycosylase family protein [Halarchaeum solikamskense]MBP2250170.1 uracil-DNA glycosylase family 4 [Halarchaeum solikamskense]